MLAFFSDAGPFFRRTLFARTGTSRAAADAAVATLEIHDVPSTRGCTYVRPANDYALGLPLAQASSGAELRTAEKLGVKDKDVEKLCAAVVDALGDEPVDADAIKQAMGKACTARRQPRGSRRARDSRSRPVDRLLGVRR